MNRNRSWSLNKKNNKIVYNVLNINENTKDKVCINADTENEKKYQQVMKQAGKTSKLWDNTGVTLNIDVPKQPIPNNYDRLLDFRKKNVIRPSIQQSNATIYLYNKGYVLGKDYEAYQAIEIHNKLIIIENKDKEMKKMIDYKNKKTPNTLKNLSLVDMISKEKNESLYPPIQETIIKKKTVNGWRRHSDIIQPEPSAPPAPDNSLYIEGNNIFERGYPSRSSEDSQISF